MSIHNVLFPDDISESSSFGPTFKTIIEELPSGKEQRIPVREQARHRIDIRLDDVEIDKLYAIKEFAMLRQGSLFGFRIRDRSDYNTTAVGRAENDSLGEAHTSTDQTIGTGDGVRALFQMAKRYSDGQSPNIVRNITKPREGTVLVAVGGVLQTEGSDYTIDYATGVVLFTTIPAATKTVTWGGEFDTPVRFDKTVEEFLSINITDFDNGSLPVLTCVEVIDEIAGISDFFPGGSNQFSFAANVGIGIADGLTKVIKATQENLAVFLPLNDVIESWPLGEYFTIIAQDGSLSFKVVAGNAGELIIANPVSAGNIVRFSLIVNGNGDRVWIGDA